MTATRALVATRKGLFIYEKDGKTWNVASHHFKGEPVSFALHDTRDGAIYAALNLGHFGPKLHRSEDGGKSWTEIPAPSFPEDASDKPTVKQIWILNEGPKREPGTLYAGCIPAGLFKSTDRGQSWSLVQPLWNLPERAKWFGGGYDDAGIHSILIDPRDDKHMLVGISCGGVWETRDTGASWQPRTKGMKAPYVPPEQAEDPSIQDPHFVAQCTAHPDSVWTQHHGGVWRSTNGAGDWSELKPPVSNFGFAVAAHPSEPDTAWFVPAESDQNRSPVGDRLVVTRTRDGGKSFDTFASGLPDRSFDLVYRHGLDVDDSGNALVMGSTTGGLWFSSDAGERWQAAAERLPPIYAVRFA